MTDSVYPDNDTCPFCNSPDITFAGGISADYWVNGNFVGVDIIMLHCLQCGEDWSE